jgi:hypothetical protein
VYDLFRRWTRESTWQQIFARLQAQADAKDLITWDININPPSAGPTNTPPGRGRGDLQVEPPGGVTAEPDDHGLGRARRPDHQAPGPRR